MNNRFIQLIRLTFIASDLLTINFAIAFGCLWFPANIPSAYIVQYYQLALFLNVGWILVSLTNGLYHAKSMNSFETFGKKTVNTFIYFLALTMLYLYFYQQIQISRIFITTVLIVTGVLLICNRLVYLAIFQFFRNRDYLIRKVMIIGYNDMAKKLAGYLEEDPIKTHIVGFCDDTSKVTELSHYPIVNGLQHAIEHSRENEVTEIYSTIAPEQNRRIYSLMKEADEACIRFKVVPDLDLFVRRPVHIDYMGEIPIISLRHEPLEDLANRIKKRLYDIVFSTFVIVFILSWMIPLLGLIIWLDSRGPIFFIQQRSGKDNKPFPCIKFRSMRVNNEANVRQATREDQRITRVGRFLRRTNLDEFPQFLNVFLSQMSVVGPRPHMLRHTDKYSKLVNQYMVRQFLKPGITGWAQVNGFRGETIEVENMEMRVKNDLWYMENWSLWLDTKIIFLTALGMVKGQKNAY